MPNDPSPHPMFEQLDPDTLKDDIKNLIGRYQQNRSGLLAWLIVRYAEALLQHFCYGFSGLCISMCGRMMVLSVQAQAFMRRVHAIMHNVHAVIF